MVRGVFIVLFLMLSAVNSYAGVDPFAQLRDTTLSFFKPVEGRAVSVDNGIITSDIGEEKGVRKGMRLSIMRPGKPYLHPITKEVIGRIETPIGTAEVSEVLSPGASRLKVITGDVLAGDIVRVSASRVEVLYYPLSGVSWGLSEHYYDVLKEAGRFELIDTPLSMEEDSEIMAEAEKLGVRAAIVLSSEETADGIILRQRLLSIEDKNLQSATEVKIDREYAARLRFGEELFAPARKAKEPFLAYDIPFRAMLVATGDVDGDGTGEIALSTGRNILFYHEGKTLKPALEGVELKGSLNEEHLWLEVLDLDGDKKADILITLIKNDKIISRIYKYENKAFSLVRKWDFFIRAIGDRIYGQEYLRGEGFKGPVFLATDEGKGPLLNLPEGINLYDFVFMEAKDGRLTLAYGKNEYMTLYYDEKGKILWQSKEDYGGFARTFKKEPPTVMVEPGSWAIKDRILLSADRKTALLLRRVLVSKVAEGMGYKNSELKGLELRDAGMEEASLIDYIPGRAVDFSVTSKSALVLSYDVRIKWSNILRGMGFVGNRLYAYPLKGRLGAFAR